VRYVAIALTTTAIGTLMPALRDSGDVETPFGTLILATGAVGGIDLDFGRRKEVSPGAAARSWVNYPLAQPGEGWIAGELIR
jgi:hypothetical protein